jgi:hypothetical protein
VAESLDEPAQILKRPIVDRLLLEISLSSRKHVTDFSVSLPLKKSVSLPGDPHSPRRSPDSDRRRPHLPLPLTGVAQLDSRTLNPHMRMLGHWKCVNSSIAGVTLPSVASTKASPTAIGYADQMLNLRIGSILDSWMIKPANWLFLLQTFKATASF